MKKTAYNSGPLLHQRSKGLALIELMIALVLGLVLIGAAVGVMLSNTQSFRTTKSLSQIQDSARLGFELMARDIRQAGAIPCGNYIRVDNILTSPPWYLDWDSGSNGQLMGYSSGANIEGIDNKVNGTEALTVLYADNASASLVYSGIHTYIFDNDTSNFESGDIAFICDANDGTIFSTTVSSGPSDYVTAVASVEKNLHVQPGTFEKNSVISKLKSRAWYIGENEQGSSSLYLAELSGSELSSIEIASGVSNLTFRYRLTDTSDFKTAAQIGSQWPLVNAVEVSLEMLGQEQNVSTDSSTDSGRLSRSFSSIVALRNRIL